MGKQWKQCQTIFLGSKITADGDCSHEIKRRLLLGRQVMTNLDSILKSRDITFPTKVCLVKAMVFFSGHVWMWELDSEESWAPKNWCFWTVVLEKTLEIPLNCKKIQPSILKEISPGCSFEGLMLKLKLQYFGHLMRRVDSLEKTLILGGIGGRRRRGQQRMKWLDGVTDLMDMNLSKLWELVMDREAWHAVITAVTKSRTQLSDWPELNKYLLQCVTVVQLPSHVQNFATPWNATHLVSLSFTTSQSVLKLMFIESVMPSNHLIFCYPLLLLLSMSPSTRVIYNVNNDKCLYRESNKLFWALSRKQEGNGECLGNKALHYS